MCMSDNLGRQPCVGITADTQRHRVIGGQDSPVLDMKFPRIVVIEISG